MNWGLDSWWVFLLLPVPWMVRPLLATARRAGVALTVPMLQRETTEAKMASRARRRGSAALLWLVWIALLCAAARPFSLGDPVARTVSGRDLMLAVDISGSMSEPDMTVGSRAATRLNVLKRVVDAFIDRRQGDRMGLILFGTRAYAYVPLTFDYRVLRAMLDDVSTGLAGRHTAIGDAIGIAIKAMPADEVNQRVLILVTDGSNTAGFKDPLRVARAARINGLTVHTIGVGSDLLSLQQTYGQSNIPAGLVLNETLLRDIASITGGRYFRATDTDRLETIYRELDAVEKLEQAYPLERPRDEIFAWPLSLGLAGLFAIGCLGLRRGPT